MERGTGVCILPTKGIPVAGASPEASRFEQAICVTNRRIRSWCGGCATSGKRWEATVMAKLEWTPSYSTIYYHCIFLHSIAYKKRYT